jgi:hypothetical protein
MKKRIIKNEKLVLKKTTITRLNAVQMDQLVGGNWTVKTSGYGDCGTYNPTSHSSNTGWSCQTCLEAECQSIIGAGSC